MGDIEVLGNGWVSLEKMILECSYFKKYKAMRKPTCNCKACWNKWLTK